jgi:tripartite-type tricarboxylate transporter receptor subunit TctC
VPFPAGGPTDVMARLIGQKLSERLGQQFIIENIGGAGGWTGAARVAKAPADGSVLLFGNQATHTFSQLMPKKPLYNAVADFAPAALAIENAKVLVTRKNFPANSLAEFITYAKANADKLQYGSAGTGSATQISCVMLNMAIGVNVTHVPYRSTALAFQDVIGGRIDYACPITGTAISIIESKQVKAPAILSKNRTPILPNLPTALEQGLTNFDAYIWNGMFLPKDTPDAIVTKLHDATVEAMNTPSVQERIKEMGGSVVAPDRRSPEYLKHFVEDEIAKWAAPIKASGTVLN